MEILAPAGDMEMLRAAVFSGADCIYLGIGALNARAGAEGFEGEGLRRAVAFCHARGCGVYAALNTLVLPGEEAAFCRAVEDAAKAGCDGLILQDAGGAATAARIAPQMPRHASTQMSVHSPAGVEMLAQMGFSRVILAREMSEEEIGKTAQTAKRLGVELEVFVHGALCVGVSGQCTLSAFLGGRSGNRGGCAGPCRLPFRAEAETAEGVSSPAADTFHLSLKDLSVLGALPRLAELGIASAKIEGRLRGPEYVAAAVDAAQKALRGEEYDREWLAGVFSRSGFTDGWFTGAGGGEMFGVRTGTDTAAGKSALPKARELYRREAPRVAVAFSLSLEENGARLLVTDGTHEVLAEQPGPFAPAQKENGDALRAALAKTGGTPFYMREGGIGLDTKGLYVPNATLSALRREALEKLLVLRENALPGWTVEAGACEIHAPAPGRKTPRPRLRARFEHVEQMPPAVNCEELLLPLWEARQVPEGLRGKTRLWLPRVLFGSAEEKAKEAIDAAAGMGFLGFEAQNIAHLKLLEGLPFTGGFGLNAANGWSVAEYGRLDCEGVTLSPELSLAQMRQALPGDGPKTDALCYGHLPLMMTRACPLLAAGGRCEGCAREGRLVDRRGKAFPFRCRDGVRHIYNPIPLWMGDRLEELPTHTVTLYFTTETAAKAGAVLEAFAAGRPAPGEFTRGLYDRGTSRQASS